MSDIQLGITLTADGSGLVGEVRVSKSELDKLGKGLTDTKRKGDLAGKGLDHATQKTRTLGRVARSATAGLSSLRGMLGALAVGALVRELINTNREFERLETQLLTVTRDGYLAESALAGIKKLAAETPFAVTELTDSFIKLVARGLTPSERALVSYGNTASAMGKSLDQLIEAVADASVGEFERLKEFGIKANAQGDQIKFTFRGVSTTVRKEAGAIEDYLIRLGEAEFAGGMERQAATLSGAISNLGDAWDNLLDKLLSDEGSQGIQVMIRGIGDALNWVAETGIVGFQAAFIHALATIETAFLRLSATSAIVWESIKASGEAAINGVKGLFVDFVRGLSDIVLWLEPGAQRQKEWKAWADGVGTVESAYAGLQTKIEAITKARDAEIKAIAKGVNAALRNMAANKKEAASLNEVAKRLKTAGDATKELTEAEKKKLKDQEKLQKAYGKEIEALIDQQNQLTLTERAYYESTLLLHGFSEEQREAALAIYDTNQALEDQKRANESTAKAAEDAAREMREAQRDIANSLTDALLRGFEDGAGFAQNFIDTLKNMFQTLVLRPILQPIVQGVVGAVGGALGLPSVAQAAGTGGNILSGISGLSNISTLFSAGGLSNLIYGNQIGGALSNIGFSGANLVPNFAYGLAGLGGGLLGGALFNNQGYSSLGGSLGATAGFAVGAGSGAIGTALGAQVGSFAGPVGALIGAGIGAFAGSLFGGGEPHRPRGLLRFGSDAPVAAGHRGGALLAPLASGLQVSSLIRDGGTQEQVDQMLAAFQQLDAGLLGIAGAQDLSGTILGSFGNFRGG